ncbi:LamG-like jellyroll fold domain-containing protein [Demequina mangrovi]|uniref:Ig-like domain (Group 4) n=1 Tax=Demequina mangrovi TaxID=1043493 RepID=A0A1H6V5Y5_9MICO|nr:LamG-like jellyroll fold domain-containing protein [Demequina mangrovi]SEI98354.1 Ig-like domain (group 4) [Demequina mangrovi]
MTSALALGAAGVATAAPAQAVDLPAPDLHYTMDDVDGTTVPDSSVNGWDGVIVGSTAATDGADGGSALALTGGTVTIPGGPLAGATDVTVSVRARWDEPGDWQWLFGLGTDTSRYLFTTPRAGTSQVMRSAVTVGGPGAEAIVDYAAPMSTEDWSTVTVVLDTEAERMTTYLDGVTVAYAPTDITAGELVDAAAASSGAIGASFYNDPTFKGAVDDFQLFRTALDGEQVAELVGVEYVPPEPEPEPAPAVDETAPDLHWTMDDVADGVVADVSGHGWDGTLVGAAETSQGLDGAALDLTGGHVTFPQGVIEGTADLTVAARVRWDGTHDWGWLYGVGTGFSRYLYAIPRTGEAFGAALRTGVTVGGDVAEAQVLADAPLATDEWSTVTVTLDTAADLMTTYVDGVAVGSAPTTVTADDLADPASDIGGYLGGSVFWWDPTFDGEVDDFRIYRGALTAAQVESLEPGALAAPDLLYTMDDVADGIVPDSSGNNLDGTIAGSTGIVAGVEGDALDLTGGAVTVPRGILEDATDLTVSSRIRWDGGAAWQWLYGLGTNTTRYLFWTPSNSDGNMRTAITTGGGGSAEDQVTGVGALRTGEWATVTTTLDTAAGVMTTYLDGVGLASVATDITAGQLLSASAANAGRIGGSFYPDPAFDGAIDEFRVYRAALTSEEVASLVTGAIPTLEALAEDSFAVRTLVGEAPALPTAASASFSDGYDRDVAIAWDEVPADAYAAEGTFTVSGDAGGYPVTAEVTVHRGQITIDAGATTGDFMGGASGVLYGLYGDGMPSENLLEGMNVRTVATKAQDGSQHPGSDALEILPTLAETTGGDVYLRVTDWYRGFPYQWPGDTPEEKLDSYREVLAEQLDMIAQIPADERAHLVIEPFNEPEGNMFGTGQWSLDGTSWLSDPTDYFAAWDETYRTIKSAFPDLRVAGPGTSVLFGQMQGYLAHVVEEGTVPDIITWHELSHPQAIRDSVERFRGWEATAFSGTSYEGTVLPININEYAFNYHTSVPGQMIQWISAIEDSKVDAMIAFWNINGNLSDSAVQTNRGNGQWWLYRAYAQMSGQTLAVTPPWPGDNYTLQGVATLDEDKKQLRAIIGGADGAAPVDLVNLPESFTGKVRVWVKEIAWTGQIGDSAAPTVLAETVMPVVDGKVSFDFGAGGLPELKESSAYEIVVTPQGSAATGSASPAWSASYEAEDAALSGDGYSVNGPEGSPVRVDLFYTSGAYNVGGLRTGSDVALDFTVDVPEDGAYDLSVFANSLNTFGLVAEQGPTNVFLTVDGADEQELFLTLGYKWVVWDHTDTTVDLTAGEHTLTLSARSLDGTGVTQGDAIVDRITLTRAAGDDAVDAYEAELAETSVAPKYRGGVSGSGAVQLKSGETATFWVYGDVDGEHSLSLDTSGVAKGSVTVNGEQVLDLRTGTEAAVHLMGGVNKVVVTGPVTVDRLLVGASEGRLDAVDYQAEDATVAGDAHVVDLSLAEGGQAVDGIGGEPGNGSTLTFAVTAAEAGPHAVVVRFSNPEQVPATHYNPNPMARRALISVNGGTAESVLFVPTFHENSFWERTLVLDLAAGENTIAFASEEQPNFDGVTYADEDWPGIPLRADTAPVIDRITVSTLTSRG